jgi:hypothetical protein
MRENYPMIVVDDKVTFERPAGGNFYTYNMGAAFLLESGMSVYIIGQSLRFMSEKLGIPVRRKIKRHGHDLIKVGEKDSSVLYIHRGLRVGVDDLLMLLHLYHPLKHKDIERQLRLICGAMNIDCDSASIGSYNPEYSKYIGWGNLSTVATSLIMTGISQQKAKDKMDQFNRAAIYVAFNKIAAYFNQVYYPETFKLWTEKYEQAFKQLP